MKNKNLLGTAQLLLAAFIWGSAFVAQSKGMEFVGPLTFMSVRFFIGGAVLIPVILIRNSVYKNNPAYIEGQRGGNKALWLGGIVCGILLAVASGFQQFGLLYTSVGNAGFITTLYVILVPLCGIFFKKIPSVNIWVAVIIATVGLYLLCMTEGLSIGLGDTLVLICAVCYTAHIVTVDHFAEKTDPIKLSCLQFMTVGVVSALPAIVFEHNSLENILAAWLPILYAGLLSSGVAFTLQVVAQKYTEPTIAAITMSFESVFAVLSGCVVLGDIPTVREWIGCAVMFVAIILAQFPAKWFRFKKRSFGPYS